MPWLVHVLPFSQVVSFQLLALLCIAASGAALYVLMRDLDISIWLAGLLAIGFAATIPMIVPKQVTGLLSPAKRARRSGPAPPAVIRPSFYRSNVAPPGDRPRPS